MSKRGAATGLGRAATGAVVALGLLVISAPTSGASDCVATNSTTGERSADLQVALNESDAGDELVVSGTCEGPFKVRRSVTLVGRATYQDPIATLTGADTHKVMRLDAGRASTVHLVDLRVVNGASRQGAGLFIHHGRVVLQDVVVAYNTTAGRGAGIYSRHGRVVLSGSTTVHDNVAMGSGGGAFNHYGTLRLQDTVTVENNSSAEGAGGGLYNTYGTIRLSDQSAVRGNTAIGGGGIHSAYGRVVLSDKSTVTGNEVTTTGGGIHIGSTHLVITNHSSVTGNTAAMGAGVYNWSGQVTLTGSGRVSGNVASEAGGGVWSSALVQLRRGSSVVDNAAPLGGGVRLDTYLGKTGVLQACSAEGVDAWTGAVSPNHPDDPPEASWVTC